MTSSSASALGPRAASSSPDLLDGGHLAAPSTCSALAVRARATARSSRTTVRRVPTARTTAVKRERDPALDQPGLDGLRSETGDEVQEERRGQDRAADDEHLPGTEDGRQAMIGSISVARGAWPHCRCPTLIQRTAARARRRRPASAPAERRIRRLSPSVVWMAR